MPAHMYFASVQQKLVDISIVVNNLGWNTRNPVSSSSGTPVDRSRAKTLSSLGSQNKLG